MKGTRPKRDERRTRKDHERCTPKAAKRGSTKKTQPKEAKRHDATSEPPKERKKDGPKKAQGQKARMEQQKKDQSKDTKCQAAAWIREKNKNANEGEPKPRGEDNPKKDRAKYVVKGHKAASATPQKKAVEGWTTTGPP